tara:strand:- start:10 stop:243 length:234 start_codon:yes stop_codon:yes gene_type:complete
MELEAVVELQQLELMDRQLVRDQEMVEQEQQQIFQEVQQHTLVVAVVEQLRQDLLDLEEQVEVLVVVLVLEQHHQLQ